MKYIFAILMLALSSAASAQTTQFSSVGQSPETGDRSGFSFLFDYSNGLRGEVLICEGGCKRFALSNLVVDDRGFTAKLGNIRYKGFVNGNTVRLTDSINTNMVFTLHRCSKYTPGRIKCYDHTKFKLKTQVE